MDVDRILGELRREKAEIEEAIRRLESISRFGTKTGRPLGWITPPRNKRRGRPIGSKNKPRMIPAAIEPGEKGP